MAANGKFTLGKKERLCSRKLIGQLFNGGTAQSVSSFPLRAVYMTSENETLEVSILVSVPKRCFKHAVDRNRVKRQVREAYRKNKHLLADIVAEAPQQSLSVAFIWLDSRHHATTEVEQHVQQLLMRVAEKTGNLWKQ